MIAKRHDCKELNKEFNILRCKEFNILRCKESNILRCKELNILRHGQR